jgi:hypothetical protein
MRLLSNVLCILLNVLCTQHVITSKVITLVTYTVLYVFLSCIEVISENQFWGPFKEQFNTSNGKWSGEYR